jgi:hypothetical protein
MNSYRNLGIRIHLPCGKTKTIHLRVCYLYEDLKRALVRHWPSELGHCGMRYHGTRLLTAWDGTTYHVDAFSLRFDGGTTATSHYNLFANQFAHGRKEDGDIYGPMAFLLKNPHQKTGCPPFIYRTFQDNFWGVLWDYGTRSLDPRSRVVSSKVVERSELDVHIDLCEQKTIHRDGEGARPYLYLTY